MKRILCFGDSNTWGAKPHTEFEEGGKWSDTERWGAVLRTTLGADYWVIEEGLGGRTTVFPDPIEGHNRNGLTYLQPCIESHSPLDLVIILLGTNDLKSRFAVNAFDIAQGAGMLVQTVQNSLSGPNWQAPQVLLLAPPPVVKLTALAKMFEGATEKSKMLGTEMQNMAQQLACHFFDTAEIIASSDRDGIHLEAEMHQKLGTHLAGLVHTILED